MWNVKALRQITALLLIAIALTIVWIAGLPDQADLISFTINGQGAQKFSAEIGGLAPPFTVTTLDNQSLSLNARHGKVIILNFWATWCGPCITEMPLLETVYQKYRTVGLWIIAVNSSESRTDILSWQQRFGFSYDLVPDDGTIAALYRLRGLPSTYFIGRDGIIKQIAFGALDAGDLDSMIESLLKG
jgi:cytochrome c biogenesis protein CcmG, thiol:disulfide interchange protein DsbE